jgi:hypothetical protein
LITFDQRNELFLLNSPNNPIKELLMRRFTVALFLVSIIVLSGCSSSPTAISQPPTAYPSYTPLASFTPNPTYTPYSTYTPYPTYTPFPTPTAIVPTDTSTPLPAASADQVIEAFKAAGIPITNEITYTAETDPNKLLGRPHQYIGKISWVDTRISTSNEPDIDNGGTIETFANEDDLLARKQYIDALSQSSLFAQYIYSNGLLLLRVSGSFTPDQAKGYEDVFMSRP